MGATNAAAATFEALIRIDDPDSLPSDLDALRRCHSVAEDLLLWHSDSLEPSWEQAQACGAEMTRLQELQTAVLVKAAALAATKLDEIRHKLVLWQSVTEDRVETEEDAAAQALAQSVIRDLDRLCGVVAEEHATRPN